MSKVRFKVAESARRLYKKEISFNEFLKNTPEPDEDELIDELIDLIIHEPQKGGFWGVSKK